jgi:DNA (cytosine-5)-methyltransferase 1
VTAAHAFYNDVDPFVCEWMRTLVARGHIAPGTIDDRSIKDLTPDHVAGPGQRHFFAGIAGWAHALRLAGVPDDADVWTGSCPCQPFSGASKHARARGVDDERHLWPAWFQLIRECLPVLLFGEQISNSAGLAWFDVVRADLEGAGYAVGVADLCAASCGAPHIRQRLWFVATRGLGDAGRYRDRQHARELPRDESEHGRRPEDGDHAPVDPGSTRGFWSPADWLPCSDGVARPVEPGTFPMASGVPARVGRLRAYGNSIPPEVAATFIKASLEAITESR